MSHPNPRRFMSESARLKLRASAAFLRSELRLKRDYLLEGERRELEDVLADIYEHLYGPSGLPQIYRRCDRGLTLNPAIQSPETPQEPAAGSQGGPSGV